MDTTVDQVLLYEQETKEQEVKSYENELEEFIEEFLQKEPYIASLVAKQSDFVRYILIPTIIKGAYYHATTR